MNRTRLFYAIFIVIAVVAAGYFAYSYLAPPTALAPLAAGIKTGNTAFINSSAFSSKETFVNLPITTTNVGWETPFQSIYNRNLPGVYVAPNDNANTNANNPQP